MAHFVDQGGLDLLNKFVFIGTDGLDIFLEEDDLIGQRRGDLKEAPFPG